MSTKPNTITNTGCWDDLYNYTSHKKIKHYSFDFWNTIAFSNKNFKNKRTHYFYNLFDASITHKEIEIAFSSVGKDYNEAIELGASVKRSVDLYQEVVAYLGISEEKFNYDEILADVNQLFLENPPIIAKDFIAYFEKINTKHSSVSITSNTAFIPGKVIEMYLKEKSIFNKLSFCIFSDEVSTSKPNVKIFEILKNKSRLGKQQLHQTEIIHIGDSYIADFRGSIDAGIDAFQITNKELNPKDFKHGRYAAHTIIDDQKLSFSSIEYSRFKFGDGEITENYGNVLFAYFQSSLLPSILAKSKEIVIYSSPYAYIPTASFYLTKIFFRAFSDYLIENKFNDIHIRLGKILRKQTYVEDYGSMNAEQRYNLIKHDTYQFEDKPTSNEICIFIDDISITGTHQRVVEKLLTEDNLYNSAYFLYFAILKSEAIEPSFENILNYQYVSNLNNFIEVIVCNSFKINTRAIKYALSLRIDEFQKMISHIIHLEKFSILENFYENALGNGYNEIGRYSVNLQILKDNLNYINTNNQY
jgi:FMN phosphatase YigB (HAD superfamily)